MTKARFSSLLCAASLMLAACGNAPTEDRITRAAMPGAVQLPAMKFFATPRPVAPARSNRDIARDFLELSFQLESGRQLPAFSRFEGPIAVRVTGSPPPTLGPDLTRLMQRLRSEAGIDIGRVKPGAASAGGIITVEAVTRKDIRRFLPKAACFVVPNVGSLEEYRTERRRATTSWSTMKTRTKIAIFVPADSSPQELRDCLHEELAQALGPLNDLYRLPDSVFNDDNIHTVLTGFDMLILRAYYAGELRSGMSRAEVAARLPAILSRLNPQGDALPSRAAKATPRSWINAIQTALGPGTRPAQRRRAASQALAIAQAEGWTDHRLAFSHIALGRLSQNYDPEFALGQFIAAEAVYRNAPNTDLHRAYSASQLAAYAISQGRAGDARRMIAPHLTIAERHENAALLATLQMLEAEALDMQGETTQARATRLDSLGWARYGFGSDWAVRAKLQEISALNPIPGTTASGTNG